MFLSKKKIMITVVGLILAFALFSSDAKPTENAPTEVRSQEVVLENAPQESATPTTATLYPVVKVVDGDTIDVAINGATERVRLIGINTPETVDPRRPVECFGKEASARAKELLTGVQISLESEVSQGDRDKYGRLLRYVFLEDGTNVNERMIEEGYAHEYTYDLPYKYQSAFRAAETRAREAGAGLWGAVCDSESLREIPQQAATLSGTEPSNSCTIKGNINREGEKIYHTPGCGSYEKTQINEANGEAWFCTEEEARDAGWRKALNC